MIADFQEKLHYKPTKLEFNEVSLETTGFFGFFETVGENCDSTENMNALISGIVDMENIIKKNFISVSKD